MPQNEHIELHRSVQNVELYSSRKNFYKIQIILIKMYNLRRKRHGYRLDFHERKRKKEARAVHKRAAEAR
jgi:hypothetical protein